MPTDTSVPQDRETSLHLAAREAALNVLLHSVALRQLADDLETTALRLLNKQVRTAPSRLVYPKFHERGREQ